MKKNDNENTTSLIAWALYDLANSAHSAVIQTFVFAAYFVSSVAINKTEGITLWGLALGLSGFVVALGGPILGALADQGGGRKKWLAFFTVVCIFSIALMWLVKPSSSYTLLALVLVSVCAVSSDFAYVFYNAMLPDLAAPERIGRWSGWGWAAGYLGGMISLILCLLAFINPSPWFYLDRSSALDIRATFLLSAAWFAIFSIPVFFLTTDLNGKRKKSMMALVRDSFSQLWLTVKRLQAYGNVFRFLVAHMIFVDALITLFAFGGVYAAAQFNMKEHEILLFGITLNISAGIGAASFAFLDDRFGGKKMIVVSLMGLILAGAGALLAESPFFFWIAGTIVGLFVGPVQASSRSYMARVAPQGIRNELFGFYALSSKVTAFLGPLSISWVTYLTGSFRAGLGTIIVFLFLGLCLMFSVKEDK